MKAWLLHKAIPDDSKLQDPSAIAEYCTLADDVNVPELPAKGFLLIKVNRGTINPNDLLHVKGTYLNSAHVPFPRPIGFEGAGTVVASTAGWFMPKVGQRVVFYQGNSGTFGEYVVVPATNAIPLRDDVDWETGACSMTNPLSTILMIDHVHSKGHKVFVNTAAASALGKLIIRYAKSIGMEVICVVRREEQAKACEAEGAKYVVNSSDKDFSEKLSSIMKETNCTFVYDAIGGPMPQQLLRAAPKGTTIAVYGRLSGQEYTLEDDADKQYVSIFNASDLMQDMSLFSKIWTVRKVSNGMGKIFKSDVQKTFPMTQLPEAFAHYSNNMSAGKVQIIVEE